MIGIWGVYVTFPFGSFEFDDNHCFFDGFICSEGSAAHCLTDRRIHLGLQFHDAEFTLQFIEAVLRKLGTA